MPDSIPLNQKTDGRGYCVKNNKLDLALAFGPNINTALQIVACTGHVIICKTTGCLGMTRETEYLRKHADRSKLVYEPGSEQGPTERNCSERDFDCNCIAIQCRLFLDDGNKTLII